MEPQACHPACHKHLLSGVDFLIGPAGPMTGVTDTFHVALAETQAWSQGQ